MVTAGVLLAAGAARRMGGPNKLLLPVGGVPLVTRAAQALVDGGLSPVVAVVGRDAEEVAQRLADLPVQCVPNPAWREGMGTSLAVGVSALGPEVDAVAVGLGDLFSIRPATVAQLVAAFEASPRGIALPVFRGSRGHPVLFDLHRYRTRLCALSGDRGARAVLAEAPEDVLEVLVDDSGTVRDVDTPAEYARLAAEERAPDAAKRETGPMLIRDDRIAEEINDLWGPVYPFMAEHLAAVSGVTRGAVLDLGPFAGGISTEFLRRFPEVRATVQDETEGVLQWTQRRARSAQVSERLVVCRAPLAPLPWPDAAFDLVVVRGAFFFLTPVLLSEIGRVLRQGGFGWVGGGYGPRTPPEAIAPIGERSRMLNEALGKRRVTPDEAASLVASAGLSELASVVCEGGLWIEVRA